MKKTAIAVGLLVLSASTSVGCKSASKLAWWKSDKNNETALAHAAPELPSDAAKKAEGGAGTQVAGGGAALSKPSHATTSTAVAAKSGSGYPSTDAPPFTPNTVTQVAASVAPATGLPAASGAAGPYDPTATPSPKATTSAVAATGTDRYGLGILAASGAAGAPAYGQSPSAAPSYSPTTDLASVASPYGTPASNATAPSATAGTTTAPAYSPASVTPVSMAATQPYRPGGTSSYNVSVARSLPSSTPTSSTGTTTAPADATATPVAPETTPTVGANRYW